MEIIFFVFFNELLSPTLVEAGKTRDHRFCFPCDCDQDLLGQKDTHMCRLVWLYSTEIHLKIL